MVRLMQRFLGDRAGATSIEYALILVLIFLAIIGAVQVFADEATALFERVAQAIDDAID